MAKYRSKRYPNIICEAYQWFDTDECFEEIRWFLAKANDVGMWMIDYTVKPAILSIKIDDYEHIAEEGDYAVRFSGYDYCVIKKDIFEKQWEQINEVEMSKIELAPDWSKAPAWANYWAVDIDGSAYWYAKEPEPNLDDEGDDYGVWHGDVCPSTDEEWVLNWRETLCKRPEPEQEETAQTDLELLLEEFREFKSLLSSELEMYNKRLNPPEPRDNQGNGELDELAKFLVKGFLRKRL